MKKDRANVIKYPLIHSGVRIMFEQGDYTEHSYREEAQKGRAAGSERVHRTIVRYSTAEIDDKNEKKIT